MVVYTKITLTLYKPVKLIEKKKDVYTFEFSSLEEAKEATRILEHRGVDAFLDEDSHCVEEMMLMISILRQLAKILS